MPTFVKSQGYRLLGLVFFAIVALLVTLSLKAYSQAFTPVTKVDLQVSSSGQLLLPGSDVKVRGLLIGQVRSIDSDGQKATVHMALHPGDARRLPANVTAQILPKTVFGEKYVNIVLPVERSSESLADRPLITLDRSKATLEISRVLTDTLPALRSINPQQLSLTLSAVASALEGRGEKLGETLDLLDSYLTKFNPHLADLKHDLSALADVAGTYADVAPDVLRILNNVIVTSRTIVAEKDTIATFIGDVTGAANRTNSLLQRAGDNVIRVNQVNKALIALLARYSPMFPCFFEGYAKLGPQVQDAVGKTHETIHSAHIVIELGAPQKPYDSPLDLPEYGDDRGPNCFGLPNPPVPQPPLTPPLKDGTEDDPGLVGTGSTFAASSAGPVSTGGPGAAFDQSMVKALLAPVLRVDANDVPDIADLLWGPLVRGAQVSLR